jgi:ABC-type spermidine/putrescine transport system permease subunit I
MVILQSIVTVIYYALIAFVVVILAWNLVRARKWEQEVLYIVVLLPFLLRLFRLK